MPTTRFAFSDRRMVRVVEPGDVEVWVGDHAAASAAPVDTEETTGGVIVNEKQAVAQDLPGSATPRATLTIAGPVHEVTTADERLVAWRVVSGV